MVGGYVNQNIDLSERNKQINKNRNYLCENYRHKLSKSIKNSKVGYDFPKPLNWVGKSHSKETKIKIGAANSVAQLGKKNSQFDTIWITDGFICKKIKKTDSILEGFRRGRK